MKMVQWIKTHRYCLAGLYLIVFLTGFFLLQIFGPEPGWIVYSSIDSWIPFNEWFVIFYVLWYFWVPFFMVYFMIREKRAYLELCLVMFGGATICLMVYYLLPNGLMLREDIPRDNFCVDIVRFLRTIDPPRNVCPSIHVSSTVAIHLAICCSGEFGENRKMKMLSRVITVGISLSTVFIKQHSVIDVFWGWMLSLGLWGLLYWLRGLGYVRVEDLC